MRFPFCSRCGRRLPAPSASPRQCAGCQLSHPDPVTSIHDAGSGEPREDETYG